VRAVSEAVADAVALAAVDEGLATRAKTPAQARQQLAASLRPLQRRSQAGLAQGCLQRLQGGQAVYWNGAGLGEIVGPVAPLFERFQVGCLSLALEANALRWQGEAAAVDGRLTPAPSPAPPIWPGRRWRALS
jgi:hypothetical protein